MPTQQKRLKILLVQPPNSTEVIPIFPHEPIGLETIAGPCVFDHDIRIVDLRFERKPLIFFLKELEPDVVGVTGHSCDEENMKNILQETKQYKKEIFNVVGGHHATNAPDDFNFPYVDAIVIGMGDVTFKELINSFAAKLPLEQINGLAIPGEDSLTYTKDRFVDKDFDSIAFPDRTLTSKYRKHYRYAGKRFGLINSAKGCPYRCSFCSLWVEMGGKYMYKSAERVFEEIGQIPEKLIRFADGHTFAKPERMEKLYELIKNSNMKKEFIFDMRSDSIVKNRVLLKKCRSIGLSFVMVGLEAVDDERLKKMNKASSVDINIKALAILSKIGIQTIGQFIIFQDFQVKDFFALEKFVIKHKIPGVSYTIATPYPGTEFYKEVYDSILTKKFKYFDMYHSVIPTKLDGKIFFQQFYNLHTRTYSLKRYIYHLANRILTIASMEHEYRKDVSLFFILYVRLFFFMRRKAILNAYKLDA